VDETAVEERAVKRRQLVEHVLTGDPAQAGDPLAGVAAGLSSQTVSDEVDVGGPHLELVLRDGRRHWVGGAMLPVFT